MGKKAKRRAKNQAKRQQTKRQQQQQQRLEHLEKANQQARQRQQQAMQAQAAQAELTQAQATEPLATTESTTPKTATATWQPSYWQAVALAIVCGLLIALALTPISLFPLAIVGVCGLFWLVSQQTSKRHSFGIMWWGTSAMMALHLWWLAVFVGNIFGTPALGALSLLLYALEGSFYGLMALAVVTIFRNVSARIWSLAVGWVLLEWLRALGPLAFPWPSLGYALIDTLAIQIADIGGVLLCSLLLVATVAALLTWHPRKSRAPQWIMLFWWIMAAGYGYTRSNADGPVQPMLTLRTTFNAFGKASGQLSHQQQLAEQQRASRPLQAGELLVWSESAVASLGNSNNLATAFPAAGITGLGIYQPSQNTVVSVDAQGQVQSTNHKAKLVPFGEYFIFYGGLLSPIYQLIERQLGFKLPAMFPAQEISPLQLSGKLYGAYVCYDSVFPWVARQLVRQGAQVLINPSNDGWYAGWGVEQHFAMGRVRAIETRRWLVRSVNLGVAGAVDDLGKPIDVLRTGQTTEALHVRPKLLSGQTLFVRYGDGIVFGLLACLLAIAIWQEWRAWRVWQHGEGKFS